MIHSFAAGISFCGLGFAILSDFIAIPPAGPGTIIALTCLTALVLIKALKS